MNLYVGNFAYDTTEDEIKAAFEAFGIVGTVKIIKDQDTGQSKGFGFVEMPYKSEAQLAMQSVTEIKGKKITVNEARPQEKKSYGNSRNNDARKTDSFRRRY